MSEILCGDTMVLYMPYGIAYATLLLSLVVLQSRWTLR